MKKKINKKKVLLIDKNTYIMYKNISVFLNKDGHTSRFFKLPVKKWQKLVMRSHLLSRMLRLGIHHLIYDDSGGYYCVYNKQCVRFTADGTIVGKPVGLIGGRPLRVDIYQGMMIYGEYRSNAERSSVSVMAFDGYSHKTLFNVENVRHIHSVRVHDNKIYYSTGDYGDEAGIWCWDGKKSQALLKGGQQCRAVDFILAKDGIYYGTDTPLEQNYIYKATYDGSLTALQKVGGSVFYMSEQCGRYWLATVVEPSEVNTSKYVELWVSSPEDSTKWTLIDTFKKDVWPMKLFQYGQIQFPYVYNSNANECWLYLQGIKGSGHSINYRRS